MLETREQLNEEFLRIVTIIEHESFLDSVDMFYNSKKFQEYISTIKLPIQKDLIWRKFLYEWVGQEDEDAIKNNFERFLK